MRLALLSVVVLACAPWSAPQGLDSILDFETSREGATPPGWGGGPAGTIYADRDVVHGGEWSARLERDGESPRAFSSLTKGIPIDFGGTALELRGFLRTQDVTGYAGLWLREDGDAGVLQFDNMASRKLRGTTDWTEYSIELPLDPKAERVVFGALLSGQGKLWVDDLQLLVDGKPIAEAPKRQRDETVLDRDKEFDEGSGVEINELSSLQEASLFRLGRVWGFIKYHHPRVTYGEVHWDYELFRVLPEVLEANDRAAANITMVEWLQGLGEPEDCEHCAEAPQDPYMPAELDWIGDRDEFGPDLSAYLQRVHRNRHALGKQFFVSKHQRVGNPEFPNEKGYSGLENLDAGYRILALFRYWNIIRYWFPYRDLIDEDWDEVLADSIPRFVAAEGRDEYRLELLSLIVRVHDGHANLSGAFELRPPRGDCMLPVILRFVQDKAVVVGYLHATAGPGSGLQIGDAILSLDGVPVEEMFEAWTPYYAASNRTVRRRDMTLFLTRGECGDCRMHLQRQGQALGLLVERMPKGELNLRLGRTHDLPGETFRLLSEDIAYLKLSSAEAGRAGEYVKAAAGTRGLIIDIRNYPSEFMVFALGRLLVRERIEFAMFTIGDLFNPGAFVWGLPVTLEPTTPGYEGKVVILVDEVSVSQSEYTAMAFRAAPNAVVVGSTTAGADGNVSRIPLPGGLSTRISGIGVFYPDKTPTQRVGIIADVEVRPTIESIRQGRDLVLEEAVRQILGEDVADAEIRRIATPSAQRTQ